MSYREESQLLTENQNKDMIYNGNNGDIMDSTYLNDLWCFDLTNRSWTNLTPVGENPEARSYSSMAYDPTMQQVVMFGGWHWRWGPKSDTWIYDWHSNGWIPTSPTNFPSRRCESSMAYDPTGEKVILFGGEYNPEIYGDVWAFDSLNQTWSPLTFAEPIQGRALAGLVYDPDQRKMLLYGGFYGFYFPGGIYYSNAVYSLDMDQLSWANPDPTDRPPPSGPGCYSFHSSSNRALAVFPSNNYDSLWMYNSYSNSWTSSHVENSPSSRAAAAFAYDPFTDQAILFGGTRESAFLRDTWLLTSTCTTGLDGQVVWIYSENSGGQDSITARAGNGVDSNPIAHDWLTSELSPSFSLQGAVPSSTATFTVGLYPPGTSTPSFTYTTTTLAGAGSFNLLDLAPSNYDIKIKESRALSTLRAGVELSTGTTTIDFGELRVGDANGDDVVNILDFAILKGAIFTWGGQPNFDRRPDFNGDGVVNIMDFALMKSNFGRWGPI